MSPQITKFGRHLSKYFELERLEKSFLFRGILRQMQLPISNLYIKHSECTDELMCCGIKKMENKFWVNGKYFKLKDFTTKKMHIFKCKMVEVKMREMYAPTHSINSWLDVLTNPNQTKKTCLGGFQLQTLFELRLDKHLCPTKCVVDDE